MEIKLKVVQCPPESELTGHVITIDESGATIGRAATNTLALPDRNRYVSSVHAKILFNGQHFEIIDQSTNGTFLNNVGQALVKGQPQAVTHHDQILMGSYVLEVEVAGAELREAGDTTSVTKELDDTTSLTIPPNENEVAIDNLDKWLEPEAQEPEPMPQLKPASSPEEDSLIPGVDKEDKELDPLAALGMNAAKASESDLYLDLGEGNWNAPEGELPDPGEPVGQRMDIPGVIPSDWDKSMIVPGGKNTPVQPPTQTPAIIGEDMITPVTSTPPASGERGDSLLDLVNTPSEQLNPAPDFVANKPTEPSAEPCDPKIPTEDTGLLNRDFSRDDAELKTDDSAMTSQASAAESPVDPSDSYVDKKLSDWLDMSAGQPASKMQGESDKACPKEGLTEKEDLTENEGKIVTNKDADHSQVAQDLTGEAGATDETGATGETDETGETDSSLDPLDSSLFARRSSDSKPSTTNNNQEGQGAAKKPVTKRRTTGGLKIPPAATGADSLLDFFGNKPPSDQVSSSSAPARGPATDDAAASSQKDASGFSGGEEKQYARQLAEAMGLVGLSNDQLHALLPMVAEFVVMTVEGLMRALRARQTIKNEFRMNLTMIQAVENNPLKFSLSPEDAIENLFVKKRKAYLTATEATEEAFSDIANHQLALFNGIRAAYDDLLSQFDPERLERRFQRQRGKSIFGRSAIKWEAYQDFIEELNEDQERTFKHLFGETFAEQYETSFEALKAKKKK